MFLKYDIYKSISAYTNAIKIQLTKKFFLILVGLCIRWIKHVSMLYLLCWLQAYFQETDLPANIFMII